MKKIDIMAPMASVNERANEIVRAIPAGFRPINQAVTFKAGEDIEAGDIVQRVWQWQDIVIKAKI